MKLKKGVISKYIFIGIWGKYQFYVNKVERLCFKNNAVLEVERDSVNGGNIGYISKWSWWLGTHYAFLHHLCDFMFLKLFSCIFLFLFIFVI